MKLPKFKDLNLYNLVFTHRSYLNEAGRGSESNERLEFLGDSILSFVVSSFIYKKYPELAEGELTNLRAALTNTTALFHAAQKLDLGAYLKLSKGEEASGGRGNKTILADTLEALLGGVYLDQGIKASEKIINSLILEGIDKILDHGLKDPKNRLQELTQKNQKISPMYRVLSEQGPDHAKSYTVGVFLDENLLAQGSGKSKQEAEKLAADAALAKLKSE